VCLKNGYLANRVLGAKISLEKEIIIVDDGSTDGTQDILKTLSSPLFKIIFHRDNQGKGASIRTAIKKITGEVVVIQDADLEYDPNDYQKLIQPILEGRAEVVYGSRILGSKNRSGLSYYFGGKFLTLVTNLLYSTKITDESTCYKVFKANILKSINLKCRRFEFCPEVTAKVAKKGIQIYEVPINYYPRDKKEGKKIKWRDGMEAIWTLIKYKFFD